MKEKELVSLNSKILANTSIEELEERLELSAWSGCPCARSGWVEGYGCENTPCTPDTPAQQPR